MVGPLLVRGAHHGGGRDAVPDLGPLRPCLSRALQVQPAPARRLSGLSLYLDRLLELRAFRDTVNVDHIKQGYHSMPGLNPSLTVGIGPVPAWLRHLDARAAAEGEAAAADAPARIAA